MKGQNVRVSVHLTFEEASFGTEKEIELNIKEDCAKCHGTGAKPGTQPETCSKWRRQGSGCIYTAVIVWRCAKCSGMSGLSWHRQDH